MIYHFIAYCYLQKYHSKYHCLSGCHPYMNPFAKLESVSLERFLEKEQKPTLAH